MAGSEIDPHFLVGAEGFESFFRSKWRTQKQYLNSSDAPQYRVGSGSIGHVCAQNVPTRYPLLLGALVLDSEPLQRRPDWRLHAAISTLIPVLWHVHYLLVRRLSA